MTTHDELRSFAIVGALIAVYVAALAYMALSHHIHERRRTRHAERQAALAYSRMITQVGRHADAIAVLQRHAGLLPAVTATHRAIEVGEAPHGDDPETIQIGRSRRGLRTAAVGVIPMAPERPRLRDRIENNDPALRGPVLFARPAGR